MNTENPRGFAQCPKAIFLTLLLFVGFPITPLFPSTRPHSIIFDHLEASSLAIKISHNHSLL
jgi:hypothetical protein